MACRAHQQLDQFTERVNLWATKIQSVAGKALRLCNHAQYGFNHIADEDRSKAGIRAGEREHWHPAKHCSERKEKMIIGAKNDGGTQTGDYHFRALLMYGVLPFAPTVQVTTGPTLGARRQCAHVNVLWHPCGLTVSKQS